MRRAQRFGLGLGLMAAGGLATLAPTQERPVEAVKDPCPAVGYDYSQHREDVTPATRRFDNLSAFVLGFLDQKCDQGEAAVTTDDRQVTYRFVRNAGAVSLWDVKGSTYEIGLTGTLNDEGVMDPRNIDTFVIREDVTTGSRKGGTAAAVEARGVGKGWVVSVMGPEGSDIPYAFSGNTEGSIAANQARISANFGVGIMKDALEWDNLGNQRYDGPEEDGAAIVEPLPLHPIARHLNTPLYEVTPVFVQNPKT